MEVKNDNVKCKILATEVCVSQWNILDRIKQHEIRLDELD